MGAKKLLGFIFRKRSIKKTTVGGGASGIHGTGSEPGLIENCSICLEPLITADSLCCVSTPCGHKFHESCIQNWLDSNGGHQCPICRQLVSNEKIVACPAEKSELIGVIESLVTKLDEKRQAEDEKRQAEDEKRQAEAEDEKLRWEEQQRLWEERQNQWVEERLQLEKEGRVLKAQNRQLLLNWRQSEGFSKSLNDGICHLDLQAYLELEDQNIVLKDRVKTIGITLEADRLYFFDGLNIGTFYLKGGSCGKFTIENNGPEENCTANIVDDHGALVLSAGRSFGDSITVEDNDVEGTSSVIYTKFGRREAEHPIPVRAIPNEIIRLTGRRTFVVTGSDFELQFDGFSRVTVEGDPKIVQMSAGKGGGGFIEVKGSVNGNVIQNGKDCRLFVEGSVMGDLKQLGPGRIVVLGSVQGNIEKDGQCEIYMRGRQVVEEAKMDYEKEIAGACSSSAGQIGCLN